MKIAVKLVKEISRERLGQPRPVSLVPNRRREKLDKIRRQEERKEVEQ